MICGSEFMKKLMVLVFLVFFFSFCFSLSLSVEKGSFSKGEFIDVNGFSSGKLSLFFIGISGNKEILYSEVQPDVNGFFSFNHFISCTAPAGEWKIIAVDELEEKEIRFSVNSSVECEYLRVDFINPSSSSYFRTQKFDVRVKVTDAGKAVDNAEVFFWDFQGKKKRLYFEGNGIYFFEEVMVPVNAEIKKWNLMVTAVSGGKEKDGGSNIVFFDVKTAPIKIEVISPTIKEFDFGKPLNLKVLPKYPDDSIISEAGLWIEINDERINLEQDSSGVFYAIVPTEDFNAEVLYINIFAQDSYGNLGNISLDLEPKGHLYFYIAQNAIVYIFPALFIFYVVFVSFKEGRTFVNRIILKRKRKKILILMKKLQDDYFNKQMISREVYLEQYEDYKNNLDQLENKMTELKKKQELK